MKNTRSGTPSARRWSFPDSPVTPGGCAAAGDGSMTDTTSSSSLSSFVRPLDEAAPVPDEEPEHLRGLGDGAQRDALVDAVDPLSPRSEAHRRDARAHEVAGVRGGGRRLQRGPRGV